MPFSQIGSSATFINIYNDVAGDQRHWNTDNTINAYPAKVEKRIPQPPQPLESSAREEATIVDTTPDNTLPPNYQPPPISGAAVLGEAREEANDPIVDTTPDNTPPPDDQQPPIAGAAVLDKVREEANDPIVDTTPDNTPPPNDQRPPIAGTAVLDKAGEWTTHIHPDGWTYHFRARKHQADVEFHEIRGALEDPIYGEDINVLQAASKYSLMVQLPNRPTAVGFGGLRVETYVDHSRCYASKDKELVISTTHTHQDGRYDHICNELSRC